MNPIFPRRWKGCRFSLRILGLLEGNSRRPGKKREASLKGDDGAKSRILTPLTPASCQDPDGPVNLARDKVATNLQRRSPKKET